MLGLLSSLAVFALLFLNSQAGINLVLASYCSAARLGYRGAGVNPRTLFFFFGTASERGHPRTRPAPLPRRLTTLRSNQSFLSSRPRGWRSFWPPAPVNALDCAQGGSCNMLDPPAPRSHVSHIWVPAIGYFIYTSRALFVHITLQNTV